MKKIKEIRHRVLPGRGPAAEALVARQGEMEASQ